MDYKKIEQLTLFLINEFKGLPPKIAYQWFKLIIVIKYCDCHLNNLSQDLIFYYLTKHNLSIRLLDINIEEMLIYSPSNIEKIFSNDLFNEVFESNNPLTLGWLYQYYNLFTTYRDNLNITNYIIKETQIFTPQWIADYLVDNTLGYYFGEGKYNVIGFNPSKKIEKITIFDPCMGTGHLLINAYDKLLSYYQTNTNYQNEKIIQIIIDKHLYGCDLDEEAVRWFKIIIILKNNKLNVIYHGTFVNFLVLKPFNIDEIKDVSVLNLSKVFSQTNIYGSLTIIPQSYYLNSNANKLSDKNTALINQTNLLSMQYDIVLTNPPYMGRKALPLELRNYLFNNYSIGRKELYTAFIERCILFVKSGGKLGMLTPHTWMFIKTFENLRKTIINKYNLRTLLHLGAGTFPAINAFNALACAFIIDKEQSSSITCFIRVVDGNNNIQKQKMFFDHHHYYYYDCKNFLKFKNSPLIYWLSDSAKFNFQKGVPLGSITKIRQGLATGNNKKYLRSWYEVNYENICFNASSIEEFQKTNKIFAPYNKGGDYSKWYSTSEYVIRFDKNSFQELSKLGNNLPSKNFYFKEGITWSLFGFVNFSVRYKEEGYVFDVSGSSLFEAGSLDKYLLGFLGSKVAFYYLSILAPTVNFQVGNISDLPIIIDNSKLDLINQYVQDLIVLAKEEDRERELSWYFNEHPLLKYKNNSFKKAFEDFNNAKLQRYHLVCQLEQKLNEQFIEIYQMQDTVDSTINSRDVVIKIYSEQEAAILLISYLMGVILGRYRYSDYQSTNYFYRLDDNELIEKLRYLISLIFDDGSVAYLERIINKSLDMYIQKNFFKDHLKYFKNKPIYWIFSNNNKEHIIMNIHKFKLENLLDLVSLTSDESFKNLSISYYDKIKEFDLNNGCFNNYEKFKDVLLKCKIAK